MTHYEVRNTKNELVWEGPARSIVSAFAAARQARPELLDMDLTVTSTRKQS